MILEASVVVPITPRVRLLSDREALTSLGEVYEEDRLSRGLDIDAPIMLHRRRLQAAVATSAETNAVGADIKDGEAAKKSSLREAQAVAFREVCDTMVAENVLSSAVCAMLPSADHLWIFKKQFAMQLAMSSVLAYSLSIGERTPNRLQFDKSTAQILNSEFRPQYNTNGLLETAEAVPFRLTRNLHHFLTPFGVDGAFAPTMSKMAQCLIDKKPVLRNQLRLILRDDLLSWHASKTQPHSEEQQRQVELQLRERVQTNVEAVLNRLNDMSLHLEDEPGQTEKKASNQKVYALIEAATDAQNLCSMNTAWLPWL